MACGSDDAQDHAFEVLAFGEGEQAGVIGRMGEPGQYLDLASGVDSGARS
ncbi:MAG: hypothetical protein JXR37_13175 [Kiritimatiellae bacterium]|nr:hypothetical protein [Kiritimatiellia bacterium]